MNPTAPSPRWLAILLDASSLVGLVAATALTVDKLDLLRDPGAELSCDVSPLVGCGRGLESWQGSLLGFPNSIIGMAAWSALLAVAVILLMRSQLSVWFWVGLTAALGAALVLVVFLIAQSIYVLGVLCPWCLATWAVTIPAFLATALFTLSRFGRSHRGRAIGRAGVRWLPTTTLACFFVVALLAQVRLDVLSFL